GPAHIQEGRRISSLSHRADFACGGGVLPDGNVQHQGRWTYRVYSPGDLVVFDRRGHSCGTATGKGTVLAHKAVSAEKPTLCKGLVHRHICEYPDRGCRSIHCSRDRLSYNGK